MIKNPDLRNHAESLMKNDWVTYICSSTSESWRVFPEEKRIMMSIARWAEKQKIKVYFKPKPNGLPGELDFLNDYSFSVKGISGTGCGEQMLDADYQVYRYILLNKTSLVINLYTTFGLEAAILKRPIMQMVPQKEHHNSEFFRVSLNPHLRKYFYLLDYCYPYNGSYEDIELALEECARGDCIKATQYSKHLGAWIHNNVGLMASVNEIVKDTTMINCNDA